MSEQQDQPKLLWTPDPATRSNSRLQHYMDWLRVHPAYRLDFEDYAALWAWSTKETADFWESIWLYFDVIGHQPYTSVLSGRMPETKWFEGATLNYAEHVFRQYSDDWPAILYQSESTGLSSLTWAELQRQTALVAQYLRDQGVVKGDRVVGYLPNIPEATVAWLATISMGAIWSSASPDFGAESVADRFGQITPKVLIAVNGYCYGGKVFDKMETVRALQAAIPSVQSTLLIQFAGEGQAQDLDKTSDWTSLLLQPAPPLYFEAVPFEHPMWVLYSSGTTGAPKAITHSHGGMLLEHLKYGAFHNDVHAGERFFWYTTTGWMMWNYLNAMLLHGATIVLYDGSPGYPTLLRLWDLAAEAAVQHFGISAAFVISCMKANIAPQQPLPALRSIGSTGSPLPPEGFDWIYTHVKSDVWLCSMSGGTDVCTAFVGGNPLLPVYEGEIQCRSLGCAMEAYDESGNPLHNAVGEMVVTQPMPCMPVFFWNDASGSKYRASYFEHYPDTWRHGDWLLITPRQSLVILGRSDATLNRQGIRIGTSEIYRSVEKIAEIKDSLIVNIEQVGGDARMPLFVVLAADVVLDDVLKKRIAAQLRSDYSPRHVPDEIIAVPDIPYTISGKKLELPVKRILMGQPIEQVVNPGSVRNPLAFQFFADLVLNGEFMNGEW